MTRQNLLFFHFCLKYDHFPLLSRCRYQAFPLLSCPMQFVVRLQGMLSDAQPLCS